MSSYNGYTYAKYDSDYNGILHNYKDIYNLSVSSNVWDQSARPNYLVDNITGITYHDWCSKNKLYEYVQIDFKNPFKFSPTSYTFVVRNNSGDQPYNPINWTVQGLIGTYWKNISEVQNSPFATISSKTFPIDNFTENLNSIRFVQNSPNSKPYDPQFPYVFCLDEIEIFGIIRKGICHLSLNWKCYQPLQFFLFVGVIIVL